MALPNELANKLHHIEEIPSVPRATRYVELQEFYDMLIQNIADQISRWMAESTREFFSIDDWQALENVEYCEDDFEPGEEETIRDEDDFDMWEEESSRRTAEFVRGFLGEPWEEEKTPEENRWAMMID